MKRIVETLLEEGIDESMIHRILDLIEEEYEIVNEISQETADEVTRRRYKKFRDTKDRYYKSGDSRDGEKYEEATTKSWKNSKLRDKRDVSKGIKRGEDGEFHKRF